MSPRGDKKAGGRPAKPEDEHRKQLNTRIAPETMDLLEAEKERTGKSIGKVVDAMALVYLAHPEEHLSAPVNEEAEEPV